VLGFLSHPELTQELPRHASGNYGLMDQTAALRWIHNNIERLGEDPANMTGPGTRSWPAFSCVDASPMPPVNDRITSKQGFEH
jgi:para-nitrobenzyl esterase